MSFTLDFDCLSLHFSFNFYRFICALPSKDFDQFYAFETHTINPYIYIYDKLSWEQRHQALI